MDLNYEETASFDVDAQKGFTVITGELPVPDGENIVDALNKQAKYAMYRVGSKDAHPLGARYFADTPDEILTLIQRDNENMDVYWPEHCVVGSRGFELLDGLPAPLKYDYFVYKGLEDNVHPYGACYHNLAGTRTTGVIEFLKSKGVKTVIVGGLALDYCVKTTAIQLRNAGFNVYVNLDATRGVSEDTSREAMKEMGKAGILLITLVSAKVRI